MLFCLRNHLLSNKVNEELDAGFTKGANRFSIGYGKKREGILCVGGICKFEPSSNGFSLNISSSF